ncbi:helicase SRCAP isoform X2 [Boleophthalmus pectinirostris]|uniref:helicase SRCAP isoform X2 n=1 Tax=Boleophthalmus pectinirostris TaxID=150288 RepID=UPI00242D8808|nr:helicase SRCAP isoform X2 [Boleophthalmus pectinirostris]
MEERFANIAGVFSTSSTEDCNPSEMQRHPSSCCPPLSSDIQLSNTVLQYGSQTIEEKSPSNQTKQSQPAKEAGIVDIQGTQEKTSFTLEIKPETAVKEYTGENVISQPFSFQTSTTASQASVEVQDTANNRAIEEELLTKIVTEQNFQSQTLSAPLFHNNESEQIDMPQTEISHSEPTSEPETVNVPNFHQAQDGDHESMSPDHVLDTAATVQSESICIQDTFTKPSSAPLLVGTDLVVSLQTEQGTSTEQVGSTEMPLIAQIVHSSDAHEIVVVREDGDWSGVHLNQSYLLQREDGTVCQAAIINDLGSELSAGETVHLDSQSVEVYQFCDLVEEVAEETVCGSSGIQIPHSPGYEVNLFNALLDNSDDFSVKEDLESQMDTTFHTIDESDGVIISQQAVLSSHDGNQIVTCTSSDCHTMSIQNTGVAAVQQHLILDACQSGANSNEVCLVEVAAVTSDSFAVEQASTSTEALGSCTQLVMAADQSEALQKQEPDVTASSLTSPLQVVSAAVHVDGQPSLSHSSGVTVVSAAKLEPCVSSHEEGKETATTALQTIHTVVVTTSTETACPSPFLGQINPKLLILKPGTSPVLKAPASIVAQVTRAQNALSTGSVSEECLSHTGSSVAPCSHNEQTNCSVKAPVPALLTASGSSKSDTLTENLNGNNSGSQNSTDAPVVVFEPSQMDSTAVTETSFNNTIISQPDSLAGEGEDEGEEGEEEEEEGVDGDEEMEQDEDAGDGSVDEGSSEEEGSVEEPEGDRPEGDVTSPASPHKVRQWIADRVSMNSSPGSPSPGPSSSSDWSTPRLDRSSPLRGSHGKFVSPQDQSTPHRSRGERHSDMAEQAKHEADIEHRTQALKREGFWSMKRLTRLTEPPRPKVHWEYLCEEMQWLSADFAQERRWKRGVARKVVRMVMRHHEELRQKEEKAKRDEQSKIRKVAASIAKEVRAFWSSVEKVVQYKQQSRLDEKRKKALDLQLDFIVGQTEKYSDLLSQSLAPISKPSESDAASPQKSQPIPVDEDDGDFEPQCEEEDDEETIEVEEQQEGNDAESHRKEIELLKEEGNLPLDQLLSTLNLPQDGGSEAEGSDQSSSSAEEEDEDREFTANEEDAEDEEDTIAAQEKVEGNVDHSAELDDLAKEGDMSLEELLEKYKGAYASDFEEPSASASKASSDTEVSGDEEEETEEDESDVESHTSSSESPGDSEEEDSAKEDSAEDDNSGDEGMEILLKEGDHSPTSSGSRPKKDMSHIAATAESLQPKGYTLATTKVKTPIPFLLHGTLREYQHIGLDWLVTMFEKKLNGILADEMGLGKTIQTIALLAHLACEKGNWGPHLIIVPTSVMLNWEMELKRWCPGFKILTYFGSQKERKLKRQGWTKPNAFHVCITSYKLVLQDHQAFRRKSWRYLILDEAQNIKNFKSQRWQSLLNFNSHRRLLLTGTPLQNSLMELWSLMHFLMPHVFQSHREFKEWFSNPLTGMIEGSQEYNEGLIKRLHKVLRPFLLRRIKADVEKQMPKKYEHVVRCRLSKRQRFLYDDFMSQASTRETLASGHFMSVINILMQLRKVCNHPNLFDPRPIQSPFITKPIVFHTASLVHEALEVSPFQRCDLSIFDLIGLEAHVSRYQADVFMPKHKVNRQLIQEIADSPEPFPRPKPIKMKVDRMVHPPSKSESRSVVNKPTSPVPPAVPPPKPFPVAEAPPTTTAPAPAPVPAVQQVVCSVAPTPTVRPAVHPQTAVRSSTPKPVLTVRPPVTPGTQGIPAHPSPSSVMPQRVLLSPDMQARLPSGEVVSIAQLASLAGRPVSSCQGSKPVTFQLQGNKLTLSGAQIATPRPVQGNVMHLAVTSGGQHHLISQPAQVTVQTTSNTHPVNTASSAPIVNRLPPNASSQVPSSVVSSSGVVKIVVRQSAGKDGGPVPTLAVAPSPRVAPQPAPVQFPSSTPVRSTPIARHTAPIQIAHRTPGPATAHYTIAPPPRIPSAIPSQSQPPPPRPILKVVQPTQTTAPTTQQPAPVQAAPTPAPKTPAPQATDKSSSTNQTSSPPKSKPVATTKALLQPRKVPHPPPRSPFYLPSLAESLKQQRESKLDLIMQVNERRCGAKPVYGREVLDFLTFLSGPAVSPVPLGSRPHWGRSGHSSCLYAQSKDNFWYQSRAVQDGIFSIEDRLQQLKDIIDRFTFVIPSVECPPISMHCCHPPPSQTHKQTVFSSMLSAEVAPRIRSLHRIQANMRTQFPDLRLIQYDCGKLQTLHTLLRELKTGGHRVLIFTQMTRMLDVLEQFLNYHGHIYLRLDGSTRVEQRQALMERFNADRRIFCFILSTRSGGVGVNLTGADTVIFYDSDWNPTMDAQAQDRCHRIGQTRDVHIYRLISERTVEENILKKANQKRMLGDMAIEGGNFTTAFFKEQTIRELFDVNDGEKREAAVELTLPPAEEEETVNKQSTTILEQALCRAEDEEDIVAASQAKAEQVAELAEFNENIPLDDGGENEEVEEMSKAEQEIAALVEQLTPIERYAMNFLEASLEDVCKEELKQAEEQVEAARKGLDQAKEGGLKLHPSSDDDEDDFLSTSASAEPAPTPARRGRKPKDKEKVVASTRTSGRLRGASPEMESEPTTPREVPRSGRGRPPKDPGTATPARTDHHKTRSQDSKTPKAASPAREQSTVKTRSQPNRTQPSQVPSPPTASPPKRQQPSATEAEGKVSKSVKGENEGSNEKERRFSESSLDSSGAADNPTIDEDKKDQNAMSPPSSCSRSPRKRVTADDEILKGRDEDSPSAKVLRKLPGRLVTVVEEKEPRKRKRRTSGTCGSSEEMNTEEHTDNPPNTDKDKPASSPESKTKESTEKPKEPESPILPPVRSYPPYSPPHLSPDMPVLRNLPVRRRVETENRLAAQMGELFGRGRGANQHRKSDTTQSKDSSQEANSNSTPAKRRRGRPPKSSPDNAESPSPQPTSPTETSNLTLSPKRKRGRNSKDSSADIESTEQSKTDETNPKTDGAQTLPDKSENTVEASVGKAGKDGTPKDDKSDTNTEKVSSNLSQDITPKTNEEEKTSAPEPTPPTDQEISPSTAVPNVVTPKDSSEQDKGNNLEIISSPPSITALTSTISPDTTTVNSLHTPPAKGSNVDLAKAETSEPTPTVAPPSPVLSLDPNDKIVSATRDKEMDTTTKRDSPQATTSQSSCNASTTLSSTTTAITNTTTSSSKAPAVETSSPTPSPSTETAVQLDTVVNAPVTIATTASVPETNKSVQSLPNSAQILFAVTTPPREKVIASGDKTELFSKEQPAKPPVTTSPAPVATTVLPTTTATAQSSTTLTTTTNTTSLPVNAISSTTTIPSSLKTDPPITKIQSPPPIPSLEIKEKDTLPKEQEAIISSAEKGPEKTQQDSVKMVSTSEVTDMEVEQEKKQETCEIKRKKAETSSEAEETDKEGDIKISNQKDSKQRVMDELLANPKRVLSRQSSQDSTRSSSPSSGCSTHTLTRHAHHKKTYENRNPAKRRRVDVPASEPKTEEKKVQEGDKETKDEKQQDEKQEESKNEDTKTPVQRRRSRSSSSSSDSDTDSKKEHRLTRSAKRRMQDHDSDSNRQVKKATRDRNSVNASTGGESGSDGSSVRSSRKKDTDTKTSTAPPAPPPEPEVLGKRCSALNAAAKLLAMKGSVDTPGHTPRRDSAARANAAKDKSEKAKSKAAASSPSSNSFAKNTTSKNSEKETASKPSTPNQSSRTATRSTRQCPGSLVPPLEAEYRKPKGEEKESRKSSGGKEGEREARRSSRGNSACSSISSDEGEGSRSSSNSSQRTRSISSQNADRRGSRSRATSSGSERDRSSERSKNTDKKDKRDGRESRRESRRSNKLQNEVTSSSGAEGTPDRVLRSVAALAAAQARSPAASTRSSASQNRNKT